MLVGLASWSYLLYQQPDHATNWNFLFNAGVAATYLLAGAIGFWQSSQPKLPRRSRRILICLSLAAVSWGIAFLVWTWYNLVLAVDVPYPSFADLFFLLSYPLLGVALWLLHESYGSLTSPRVLRESALIVAVSAIVIFVFLNRPDLSPDLGLSKNLLNIAYSLGDVLLVAIALIELRSGQARKHKGLYLLAGFLLLQAAGDFTFAYLNNSERYWNGDIADLLFGSSALVLALTLAQNNILRDNKR